MHVKVNLDTIARILILEWVGKQYTNILSLDLKNPSTKAELKKRIDKTIQLLEDPELWVRD